MTLTDIAPPAAVAPTTRASASGSHRGAVELRGISRAFPAGSGRREVLRGVSVEVPAGEILAVVGPSGCGKSTLLRLIGGLDRPTSGTVEVSGGPVADTDPRTAIAFQEPRLLPWRTIAQNVALGLPRGTGRRAGRARVADLLELVGLTASAALSPRQVSGGMAQRASLARALARSPQVLLLDEPFGALDALTRLRMQELLLEIHAAEPTTVVLVTHDVEEALFLADRVLLLRTVGTGQETDSIARVLHAPGQRPRDRAAAAFADLRADLLAGLGVDTHHTAIHHTATS